MARLRAHAELKGEMSAFLSGRLFSDAGQLQALDGSGGVPEGSMFLGGWGTAQAGGPYVEDLNASAVPAEAVFIGGLAFHQDGRLYVTTEAVADGDVYLGGARARQDGALRVSTDGVDAADEFLGGWAHTQAGVARTAIA